MGVYVGGWVGWGGGRGSERACVRAEWWGVVGQGGRASGRRLTKPWRLLLCRSVLDELRALWEAKLVQTGVVGDPNQAEAQQ